MNKNKTLQIIERLESIINSKKNTPEYEVAKLYIDCWVMGTLKEIKTKVIGEDVPFVVRETTYSRLFQEFINFYFCKDINPSIKIYAIAVLFDFETRDLIIDLYKQLFTKQQRNDDSHLRGYIDFNDLSEVFQFEVIRYTFIRQGAC